jgi:uncharacterized OB-fold protein
VATERPPRVMDPFAQEFWEYADKREFRMQRCDECQKLRWPASAVCDKCLSPEYSWTPISGKGHVLSWIVFHRQYFPEYPALHTAVAVELDEGPIFVCCMPKQFEETELADKMPMELVWEESHDRHGDYNLPVFKPSGM